MSDVRLKLILNNRPSTIPLPGRLVFYGSTDTSIFGYSVSVHYSLCKSGNRCFGFRVGCVRVRLG